MLFIFWLLLIVWVVVEFICLFSCDWCFIGVIVVILEIIMLIIDLLVKVLCWLIL